MLKVFGYALPLDNLLLYCVRFAVLPPPKETCSLNHNPRLVTILCFYKVQRRGLSCTEKEKIFGVIKDRHFFLFLSWSLGVRSYIYLSPNTKKQKTRKTNKKTF